MTNTSFSLLWPDGVPPTKTTQDLDGQCVRDLGLDSVVRSLSTGPFGRSKAQDILLSLTTDPAVIRYRQEIVADLWQNLTLTQQLEELLPEISALDSYRSAVDRDRSTLQDVTWRLGELEEFVNVVSGLTAAFQQTAGELQSAGLQELRRLVTETAADETYQQMAQALPEMLKTMRAKKSVTIGVNLDRRLRPKAATLISVNDQEFAKSGFVERLFGLNTSLEGIGPLHTVPEIDRQSTQGGEWANREVNPLLVPLFKDLARILDSIAQPIADALRAFVSVRTSFLAALSGDIAFYLAAVRLMERLQARGLPIARPEIVPADQRIFELEQAYNLNLALHLVGHDNLQTVLIQNDVPMNDSGRVFILTGPNQGGKTTYTQMVGLIQILAQAGLWVPAAAARVSPVDNIYTHFPIEEKLEKATGRFGDEAQRFHEIFARATSQSLILLNESLASTSPGESLYIAQDLVRMMRRMGVRAIFNTHLHELADTVEELNSKEQGDSVVVSLVASRIEADADDKLSRSYKIAPGRPLGRSYAREIAAKYGISYQQLEEQLQARGVLGE